jgi:transposase
MRHWTDTKIRAFAFCSIMALMIIRIMEYKATINDIKMSPQILKQELKDLKEVTLVYTVNKVQKKITHRSTVQKELWKIFNLDDMKT